MRNEAIIRQWWQTMHPDGSLVEIRILSGKKTYSGYFTDINTLITALEPFQGCGIYATLNPVKEACYSRTQRDQFVMSPKSTTTDADIERREYIVIDLDPERPSDTNASDAEKAFCKETMQKVGRYMRDQGFNYPIIADSANGYHLYYKVGLPNNEESTALVRDLLRTLDALFSDDKVKVDLSVYNASRIVKVIGTSSNKGTGTKDRPQRDSYFTYIPAEIRETPEAYIRKVAGQYPKPETPSKANGYGAERFDLDAFIARHDIQVVKRSRFSGGEKLILSECPFDHNHKDAAILHLDNGAIAYHCFHNSCQNYGWKEFRIHYEPDAYTWKDREEYRHKREYYGVRTPKPVERVKEDDRGAKWKEMGEYAWEDQSAIVRIPSGLEKLDRKIGGFAEGELTIISGLSGAGKSTILNLFILSAVQAGYKAAAWSGELPGNRFQSWLDQAAAGRDMVKQKAGYDDFYYAPKNICDKIHEWMRGKFWLYDNDYGSEWANLKEDILDAIHTKGVNLIVIDNLMALDLEGPSSDNDLQTVLIKDLKKMARAEGVHIMLVCHPRKEQSFQLLRKESIAGTANITNLCDNLLITHRVGRDFEKRAKDFWGEAAVQRLLVCDMVLEVAKNRSHGVVDHVIGLYYEKETRRIKNDPAEFVIYGWRETPTQVPLFELEDLPPDENWFDKF